MAYDIFISYRRSNEQLRTNGTEVARSIKQQLELRGYRGRIFFDYSVEEMDDYFDKVILSNLEKCKVLILVLSRGSMDRVVNDGDWVRREISCAKRCGLKIVPVNPDKRFDGFPENLPDELSFLPRIQCTVIHMDESFEDDIDRLIERRIKAVVEPHDSDDEQQSGGALFHIETDMECRILKFGKVIAEARPNDDTTVRLPKGRHKLDFISTECSDDRLSMTCAVEDNDMEDFISVRLLPVREKRLLAEAVTLLAHAEKADEAGNHAEAFELNRKAAEQGEVHALSNLGYLYKNGNGVKQDYAEAVKWYRMAAEQGDSDAQWSLGCCYENGNGVAKSRTEAEKWYRLAADNGHKNAKQILESRRKTNGIFMVGDYYNRNGREGVVFEVDATGSHGKIVSMKQSPTKLQWCTDEENARKVPAGANDKSDGMKNMQAIMRAITRIFNWREKYPAFAWCAAQGDGWYLPAIEELKIFALDGNVRDAVDRTLRQHGGDTLFYTTQYWSSSEDGAIFAQHISMKRGADFSIKNRENFVRAVSVF